MSRKIRIYTKTGDRGETGLFGGPRVPKDHPRVEAYGTVDELNSLIGLVRTHPIDGEVAGVLEQVQHTLFDLGAEMATPHPDDPAFAGKIPRITAATVGELETSIDRFEVGLPPLRVFILPGGDPAAGLLHLARTVCRRAERRTVTLARQEAVNPEILRYLNRLSDLLFVLARVVNHRRHIPEAAWEHRPPP